MNLNQTVTDRVYNQIKEAIIDLENLEINFGQRVNIKKLSNYFNISQTPIREALNLLIKDELLVYKPRQGYYVVNLSYRDMEEIYDLRAIIECSGLRMGIEKGNIDKNVFSQLLEEAKRIQKETNQRSSDYLSSNKDLHLNIVKSSSNSKLYNVYLSIYPFVIISRQLDPMRKRLLDEHIQIIQLLLDNDLKAVEALRNHLNKGKESGLNTFKQKLERGNKNL